MTDDYNTIKVENKDKFKMWERWIKISAHSINIADKYIKLFLYALKQWQNSEGEHGVSS